jgi:hypothetical protein
MLKRLVVEFKDELEALGVKVAELDERVAVLEDRLGGWKISGVLAFDVKYEKRNEPNGNTGSNGDTTFEYDEAKLIFERFWGEDDEYYFQARFRADNGVNNNVANGGDVVVRADRFFVEMPFFFDSRLTVGRFGWGWEKAYKVDTNIGNVQVGSFTGDQIMTDFRWDGFGFTKNFALGTFQAVLAHPNRITWNTYAVNGDSNWANWALMLRGAFQFTEQVGLDLGGIVEIGDNAEQGGTGNYAPNDAAFDKFWQIYAGLRFNFNENIAFKGIFYHQKMDFDVLNNANVWESRGYTRFQNGNSWEDDANHWALMLDVKQEALKYTSLWLEYGQFDQGFLGRSGNTIFYSPSIGLSQAPADTKYWRIAAGQEWNDKWATHIFYYGYKVDNAGFNGDWKPSEFGLGVQYKLNDYTTMGLNYVHVKDYNGQGNNNPENDDVIRFRTVVNF